MDEHRIGRSPILQKVWCFGGQRPFAPVQHRYYWRYLVSFVHPASGRTIFHLATSVNLDLFAIELEAFARAVGAGSKKQIVMVLDRAGRHARLKLRVPEHVHLLFLPAFSPELQPAEHLWPLTNTVLVNQHFASIEDLEEAQLARCAALQRRPDLICRSDAVPLVAQTHQEATRSEAHLRRSRKERRPPPGDGPACLTKESMETQRQEAGRGDRGIEARPCRPTPTDRSLAALIGGGNPEIATLESLRSMS